MTFGSPPWMKAADPEPTSPKVELTAEEIKNGWTAETLAEYLAERERQNARVILGKINRGRPRPARSRSDFDPHEW